MDTAAPSFEELLADSRRTPRRKSLLSHGEVTRSALAYFYHQPGWEAEHEVDLPTGNGTERLGNVNEINRRADVVAFNRIERLFHVVEAKAAWNDFQRDRKWLDVLPYCHLFSFAVTEEMASCARRWMEDWPGYAKHGIGLMVVPNFDTGRRRWIIRPGQRTIEEPAMTAMLVRWSAMHRSRLIGARLRVAELEGQVRFLIGELEAEGRKPPSWIKVAPAS